MHWLIDSWRIHLPTPAANLLLSLVAVVCGGIIGVEREQQEKPAGLRTLILVCLGSTLFTIASLIFNTSSGDSGRVAAQIVTGIGFLGAGAILHGRSTVSGMTTAASIWVVAAIGVLAGTGYAVPALGASLLVRILFVATARYETHLINRGIDAARIIERVGADNIFIHLDTYHMHIEEESFASGFEAAAPFLGYVHVSEANRGVPGRGMLNWAACMKAIADIGYQGPITLESMNHVDVDIAGGLAVWRPVAEDPRDVIEVGLPFLREEAKKAGLTLG